MNKRIQELALQSNAWHQIYDQKRFMVDSNFDIEKFAELIVEECANQCLSLDDFRKIKRHFGVEEK